MFGTRKKDANFKFDLGDELKDKITGFKGIVTSRTQWIHNCNVYGLQPKTLKDGKPAEKAHFDEPQLEIVKKEVMKKSNRTGGPSKSSPQTNR